MGTNPYTGPSTLPDLLWETELAADRYSSGDVILVRTRHGWRSFFGPLHGETLAGFERNLDEKYASFESVILRDVARSANLVQELQRLLANAMEWFPGYRPMRMTDDLEQGDDH